MSITYRAFKTYFTQFFRYKILLEETLIYNSNWNDHLTWKKEAIEGRKPARRGMGEFWSTTPRLLHRQTNLFQ